MGSNAVLVLAGLLVWSIAGVRVVGSLLQAGVTASGMVDLLAWLVFIGAFALHVWRESRDVPGARVAALAVQSFCAIRLAYSAGGTGMEVALLVMVAGQLPGCLSIRASMLWAAVQTSAVLLAQFVTGGRLSLTFGILFFGSYLAFQLFAIGAASLAESERQARIALAGAKAELEKMHGLALESARHAERLRIARDLHDSLGHRLTALGLALEAARHVKTEDVPEQVGKARELASALMDDLRRSVGEIRDNETSELRSLMEDLARSVTSPRVSVEIADSLRITNQETVTALFRMSQEIITNATRHAGAHELRLGLRPEGAEAWLEGVDDGVSTVDPAPGNGLTGIRERARLLGGFASWGPMEGGGFRVLVKIPLSRLS